MIYFILNKTIVTIHSYFMPKTMKEMHAEIIRLLEENALLKEQLKLKS
jgi:hypothetical protein